MDEPSVYIELNSQRKKASLDKLRVLARENLLSDATVVWINGKRYLYGEIASRLQALTSSDASQAKVPNLPVASIPANDMGVAPLSSSFDPFAAAIPSDAQGKRLEPLARRPRGSKHKFEMPAINYKIVVPCALIIFIFFCFINAYLGFLYFKANQRKAANEYEMGEEIDMSGELFVSFRDSATKLPKNFYGHDPSKVYKSLENELAKLNSEKGEFETTEEYVRRLISQNDNFRSKVLYDSVLTDSRLAFSFLPLASTDGTKDLDSLSSVALESHYDADSRTLELSQWSLPAPIPENPEGRFFFLATSRSIKIGSSKHSYDAYYSGIALDCKGIDISPYLVNEIAQSKLSWRLTDVPSSVASKMKNEWGMLCVCYIADVFDCPKILFQAESAAVEQKKDHKDDLDKIISKVETLSKLSPLSEENGKQQDGKSGTSAKAQSKQEIGARSSRYFAVQYVEFWLFDYDSGRIYAKYSLAETLGGAAKNMKEALTILEPNSEEWKQACEAGVEAQQVFFQKSAVNTK